MKAPLTINNISAILLVLRVNTNTLLVILFTFFASTANYSYGQDILSVSTDRSVYDIGDIVIVFGTVPRTENAPVVIQLMDPNNEIYVIGEVMPGEDGSYTFQFQLQEGLTILGRWTVQATYSDQTASNYFIVAANNIETGNPFTVRTDKSLYTSNEVITVSGTVPVIGEGHDLMISVLDPTGIIYAIKQVVPDPDGKYSFRFSIEERLAIDGLYTVMATYDEETVQTEFELDVRAAPAIKIEFLAPNEAKWGIDTVTVSGNVVNVARGDTVTIDWGDNTSTTNIPISDSSWGPVTHVYNFTQVGNRQIVAKLVSDPSSRETLASDTSSVNVMGHATYLTLDSVTDLSDNRFIVSGRLYDADTNEGIPDQRITLTVSSITQGSILTGIISTTSDGSYTGSEILPVVNDNELLVQTHFAGGDRYLPSDSESKRYIPTISERTITEVPGSIQVVENFPGWLLALVAVPAAAIGAVKILQNIPNQIVNQAFLKTLQ